MNRRQLLRLGLAAAVAPKVLAALPAAAAPLVPVWVTSGTTWYVSRKFGTTFTLAAEALEPDGEYLDRARRLGQAMRETIQLDLDEAGYRG